ncbi:MULTISPECIES: hypothetical protein [Bradyrhizobium]|nr:MULTISPECIES: hypothetical protein [Bradyrhizobium]MDU6399908.1 hypothetical protein [Bradyrhizobium sp.]
MSKVTGERAFNFDYNRGLLHAICSLGNSATVYQLVDCSAVPI